MSTTPQNPGFGLGALVGDLIELRTKLQRIQDTTPSYTQRGQGEQEICRLTINNLDRIIDKHREDKS